MSNIPVWGTMRESKLILNQKPNSNITGNFDKS